jgi:hypothetical protein
MRTTINTLDVSAEEMDYQKVEEPWRINWRRG